MARLGRYFIPDQALHVIQRGSDRKAVFFDDGDFTHYRDWLIAASKANRLAVHAYVLMTNHVHLLVTPEAADSLPRTMQTLGRLHVRFINGRYRRTGSLWEGRYRAAPIDSEAYFVACCRYIELNDLVGAHSVRRKKDDPGTPDTLLRRVAVTDQSLQAATIGRLQSDGDSGAHAPDSHANAQPGIPLGIQMSDFIR